MSVRMAPPCNQAIATQHEPAKAHSEATGSPQFFLMSLVSPQSEYTHTGPRYYMQGHMTCSLSFA